MTPPKQLVLSRDERDSKLWRKLMDHWNGKLVQLRLQNDGDKTEAATASLRGRIAECKSNLALDKEAPEID